MKIEDYNKYYIQGSDHYLIPKYEFKEIFREMNNWKEDTKKYKEVIDRTIEYINVNTNKGIYESGYGRGTALTICKEHLLEILKGDSNE